MSHRKAILALYRQYFKATQSCSDLHLQHYVRRRLREDIENCPSQEAE